MADQTVPRGTAAESRTLPTASGPPPALVLLLLAGVALAVGSLVGQTGLKLAGRDPTNVVAPLTVVACLGLAGAAVAFVALVALS